MKKPKIIYILIYILIRMNSSLIHNDVSIIVIFLCQLFFIETLQIKGLAVGLRRDYLYNPAEGYRTLSPSKSPKAPQRPQKKGNGNYGQR